VQHRLPIAAAELCRSAVAKYLRGIKAIKSIGKDSPIKALKTLKTIAENSHKLIGPKNRKNPKIP